MGSDWEVARERVVYAAPDATDAAQNVATQVVEDMYVASICGDPAGGVMLDIQGRRMYISALGEARGLD